MDSQQVLAALAFVPIWLGACAIMSLLGGWHQLAGRFRDSEAGRSNEGERFVFGTGMLGWKSFPTRYTFCLFATVTPNGFTLSVLFPFRFMHPPLFIPWSAVERCRRVRSWFWDEAALNVEGFGRRVELAGALGTKIREAWKRTRAEGAGAPAAGHPKS